MSTWSYLASFSRPAAGRRVCSGSEFFSYLPYLTSPLSYRNPRPNFPLVAAQAANFASFFSSNSSKVSSTITELSSRDAAFCLPGFEGLSAPHDLRLRTALVCPKPFSPSPVERTERTIVVNNLTVLFRLILWHRKTRGHKRQPTILVDSWGVDTRDVGKVKFILTRFWQHVISARERYLNEHLGDTPSRLLAGGDEDVGPVRVRIPGVASGADARLASLVDKLRADITDYGLYRQVRSVSSGT